MKTRFTAVECALAFPCFSVLAFTVAGTLGFVTITAALLSVALYLEHRKALVRAKRNAVTPVIRPRLIPAVLKRTFLFLLLAILTTPGFTQSFRAPLMKKKVHAMRKQAKRLHLICHPIAMPKSKTMTL